jgi:hypothetical protein
MCPRAARRVAGIVLGAALLAPPAPAQVSMGQGSPYKAPYVSLEEILSGFEMHGDRWVRTSGRLDMGPSGRFRLRDDDGNALDIVAASPVSSKFDVQARTALGRECEVTGTLKQRSTFPGSPARPDTLLTLYFDAYTISDVRESPPSRPSRKPPQRDPPAVPKPASQPAG